MPEPTHNSPAATTRPRATLRRALFVTGGFAVAACAAIAIALAVGSVSIDGITIVRALTGEGTDTAVTIVRELRLPRALAAFAVGGLLALAGALMQVLLRNPLADPYVLGISGGAAVAALSAMLMARRGARDAGGVRRRARFDADRVRSRPRRKRGRRHGRPRACC